MTKKYSNVEKGIQTHRDHIKNLNEKHFMGIQTDRGISEENN